MGRNSCGAVVAAFTKDKRRNRKQENEQDGRTARMEVTKVNDLLLNRRRHQLRSQRGATAANVKRLGTKPYRGTGLHGKMHYSSMQRRVKNSESIAMLYLFTNAT